MRVFGDFHIHIGRAAGGKPIKITGARSLTFENIVYEAVDRKGLNIIGIIDCLSPYVISDIEAFIEKGEAYEQEKGGIIYKNSICVIMGAEVETVEINEDGSKGLAHNLIFFKKLEDIKKVSKLLSDYITNITLSTQNTKLSGYELYKIVKENNGILIPAHIFTPFKSYYGNCSDRLKTIFKEYFDEIKTVELGLSADTEFADRISELKDKVFLTNSDAHSLPKIAREYNELEMEDITFESFKKIVTGGDNKNYIVANYGMDPKLGKYNRTYCDNCNSLTKIQTKEVIVRKKDKKTKKIKLCSKCLSNKVTKGVEDRIEEIQDQKSKSPKKRPKYIYQLPLQFIPGIGKKTLEKLLDMYGTEMNILHKISKNKIEKKFGKKIAEMIEKSRNGRVTIKEGGGGHFGKISK